MIWYGKDRARGDYVACPACGYVDDDPTDYPKELMRGHSAVMECESCGAVFTASLYVEHTYTTRLMIAAADGEVTP